MSYQLSEGAISKILAEETVSNPVFQILGYKKIPGDKNDRYRLLVSDGKCSYPYVLLGTQLAGLISSGNLEKFTVVQVNKYVCTTVTAHKKVIMVLELKIISAGSNVGYRIGQPVLVENGTMCAPSSDSSLKTSVKSLTGSTPKLEHQDAGFTNTPTSLNSYHKLEHQTLCSANVTPSPNVYHQFEQQHVISTNVPSCPNTYSQLRQQDVDSTNVPPSPNTCIQLGQQAFSSTNITSSPNTYSQLRQQDVDSTNERPSPNTYNQLGQQTFSSTNIPTSNAYHKVGHQAVASVNVLPSPNTYSQLGQQAFCSTNITISPNANPKVESQAVASINVPPSPNTYRQLEQQAFSSTKIPISPNACRELEHKVVRSTDAPISANVCDNVIPISSLTPYQNKWTIRARVTNKARMREYSTSRGNGKFFSVDFIDESGEIRAVAFNECADRFYPLIECNNVYYISKARLKFARKQFTTLKNDYEMNFTGDTTVVPCKGSFDFIPSLQFNFTPIHQMDDLEKDSLVDAIGVCRSSQEVETVLSKANLRELRKRDITLVDQYNTEIILTLWQSFAEDFNGSLNPVVALKGARITDFRVRSLSTICSTSVHINPDIEEAHVLRKWFDTVGRYTESQCSSLSLNSSFLTKNWKTLAQAREEMEGVMGEPMYYKAKATVVTAMRENCMYMSCPSDGCSKKVKALPSGKYECIKCGCEYDDFKWRLLLRVSFADFLDEQWATCFDETAESLLNKNARDVQMLRESSEDAFDEVFSKITFEPFILELRTKMEVYNEENKLKTAVLAANPVSPMDFSKKLLGDIKQMEELL